MPSLLQRHKDFKKVFLLQPNKKTGGLSLVGIVKSPPNATTHLLQLCTLQQVREANHPRGDLLS